MSPKVGCAGILVADTFCGPMETLPREGELLTLDTMPTKPGGCAANVAIDLAKQGIAVEVAGCVGRDAGARMLLDCFANRQINCTQVVVTDEYPTSSTVILLVKGQDRRYIHVFGANRVFSARQLSRLWLENLKVFYLGGLFALPGIQMDELREVLAFCRSRGVATVVDVVLPQSPVTLDDLHLILPEIDYFLPNDDEARRLTGSDNPREQLVAFLGCGANRVVITRGPAGVVATDGETFWQADAYPISAVDPSGAGDAFSAGIVTGIVRGWDLERTLPYAAALGASATRAVGTTDGVYTAEEGERFVMEHPLRITRAPWTGATAKGRRESHAV